MSWFYAFNNEQKGPVTDEAFNQLVQQGVITRSTLVWREGMTDWHPHGEIAGAYIPAPPAPGAGPGLVCSQCGRIFAPDDVIHLGAGYVCAACKPIATQKLREGVLDDNSAEKIRRDHLHHEASVKSIGLLYFIGAACLLVAGIMGLSVGITHNVAAAALGVLYIGFAAAQIWLAMGLRKLKRWARVPSGILSALGLIVVPIGTIISVYILYLLFSKKGSMVFSDEYQRIVQETPHIKYRTSIIVWIFLGLILLLLGLGMVGLLFRVPRR